MDKMIMPRCAICGKPASSTKADECPHEGERLGQAIFQAEVRWIDSWLPAIKDWVTNESVRHVTHMFDKYRMHRLISCRTTARSLPYFGAYSQYQGQPPPTVVPPANLAQLRGQLTDLDARLQTQVDEDWKTCVRLYPRVLDYFFSQILVSTPPVQGPNRPLFTPPRPPDLPSSPIESNSPEPTDGSNHMAVVGQMTGGIIEDGPIDGGMGMPMSIPGGMYTQQAISQLRQRSRRPSQAMPVPVPIPVPQLTATAHLQHLHQQQAQAQTQAQTVPTHMPTHLPTHRRSRRWSSAAVQEAYMQQQQQHPQQQHPHQGTQPMAMPQLQQQQAMDPYGRSPAGYGGVSLQAAEAAGLIGAGGVRISPTRDSSGGSSAAAASRRRASYVQPSTSRHRLSAHFADELDPNMVMATSAPVSSSVKSSRRPSLPASAHYYSQPGSVAATSAKTNRHSGYYAPASAHPAMIVRH